MAINKKEKRKFKLDSKKIGRILCFAVLTIALMIGIIFSSVKVNMNITYGPEYNGAYQASVQVIEPSDASKYESLDDLAESLGDKLAPFSDKTITISKQGKNHLNVIVGKQDYQNNENYLRDSIESNGGLFMLSGDMGNLTTDDKKKGTLQDFYLTAKDASKFNGGRISAQDIFNGDVTTNTLPSTDSTRDPFVQIGLKSGGTTFQQILVDEETDSSSKKQTSNSTNLYFVNDLEQMVNTLRFFFVVNKNPKAVDVYFNDIIKPMQKFYNQLKTDAGNTDALKEAEILRTLFGGTVNWKLTGSLVPQSAKVSLLDTDFGPDLNGNGIKTKDGVDILGINNVSDLKNIIPLFTPNTDERPTSDFIYSANATKKETTTPVESWFTKSGQTFTGVITKSQTFEWILNAFVNKDVLFAPAAGKTFDENAAVAPKVNPDLLALAPQLNNNILYRGPVSSSTKGDNITTSIDGEVATGHSFIVDNADKLKQGSTDVKNGFYLRTKNLTSAKQTVASIKQSATGVSYLVESITNVNPYITSVLYIVSLVFMSLIALLLMIYVLFVYRLLGLFTIIIAACSVAIVLLAATGFGIAMGPQVICALFLIIALIMDTNFILFEGFKRSFYKERHGIISSFRIGNRETLAMAIDAVLVAFIPNIVLFWTTSGPLKTFGTLSIIGVGLAVICGIIIGRFIYWLILKARFVQDTDWLLPIDTRYTALETMRDEFAINKYTNYLEHHEGKTSYTSKELIKIHDAKDALEEAQKSYQKHLLLNNNKVNARDERTVKNIKKNSLTLIKWRDWFIKAFKIKHPEKNLITRAFNARLGDNQFILDVDKDVEVEQGVNKSKLRDKGNVVRQDRMVSRGMMFLTLGLIIIGIIAAIVGGVLGVGWASGTGYGQQFVVYGDQLKNIHDNITTGNKHTFKLTGAIEDKWNDIRDQYEPNGQIVYPTDPTTGQNNMSSAEKTNFEYRVYAYELRELFAYVNDDNSFENLGQASLSKKIEMKDAEFTVILNYQHLTVDNKVPSNSTVALRMSSTSSDKSSRSAMKRLLVYMATGIKPNSDDMNDHSYDTNAGGIEAYDFAPYTISNQIRNVGIAFGIALAVLVAYILIRFKWTYYVALALGLGLVIGVVVALIVIFRVPMSVEMLSGMVFVITFALTSMILVLGRGKSKLNLEDKENVEKNFSGSIKLATELRHKKAEAQKVYKPIKAKMQQLRKDIREIKRDLKKTGQGVEDLEKLEAQYGQLKNDYKAKRKEQLAIYRKQRQDTKQKQNDLQRKNWYFKALFSDLIKYSAWRMVTLGVFYLLVGIILAATLPTIFGMGLTIVLGIIATMSIALFISVPIWVYFEKRRIRYVYGRKKYIESLKVSKEEEIVKGVND